MSRSTAARPRVPSTISGSSSDRATASANPTADRALDRPRLVPPERADLRPLSQWRSGVAVRSLDKPSGDTSERAMTRRVSTSRADATPCGPRHQKTPVEVEKSHVSHVRGASDSLPRSFRATSTRFRDVSYGFHAPIRLRITTSTAPPHPNAFTITTSTAPPHASALRITTSAGRHLRASARSTHDARR